MTWSYLLHCDAIHPERTPPECRAFLNVPLSGIPSLTDYLRSHGWDAYYPGKHRCPSCAGEVLRR